MECAPGGGQDGRFELTPLVWLPEDGSHDEASVAQRRATCVAIPGGFVCLAAIVDAWTSKVVGYAISGSMDARIAVAVLKAVIRGRSPPLGCIHHSDRGSQ